MTRKVCFAAMAALALTALAPQAHALVCERGYVTEMMFAAQGTEGGGAGYPRVLFRTDQTGFTPLPSPLTKVVVNERAYTALGLSSSATAFDQDAYDAKVQTIRAAFLARTPIRVYSFGDRDCTTASKLEIMICTSETACDL